jgi:hypothetical protein
VSSVSRINGGHRAEIRIAAARSMRSIEGSWFSQHQLPGSAIQIHVSVYPFCHLGDCARGWFCSSLRRTREGVRSDCDSDGLALLLAMLRSEARTLLTLCQMASAGQRAQLKVIATNCLRTTRRPYLCVCCGGARPPHAPPHPVCLRARDATIRGTLDMR